MMISLLAVLLLASPVACPPDVGQIKWERVDYSFKAQGARYVISATIWDRDRDGKPSHNDLMRVESATLAGDGLAIDQAWVTIRGKLAKRIGRRFKRAGRTPATCESRFQIKGVSRAGSAKKLGRFLRDNAGYRKSSPAEAAQDAMGGWAAEICKGQTHVSEGELANRLSTRARRAHRRVGKRRLKRIARQVAKDWGMKCAHLTLPKKLTFE